METSIEPRAAVIAGGRRFRGRAEDAAWLVSVIANEGVTHVIHAGESWTDTFVEQPPSQMHDGGFSFPEVKKSRAELHSGPPA